MQFKCYTEWEEPLTELFRKLENKNCLRDSPNKQENLGKIHHRMRYTNELLKKFQKIKRDEDEEFRKANRKWFNGHELDVLFSDVMTHFLLQSFELMGSVLQTILKPDIEIRNKKIGDRMITLGGLCNWFSVQMNKKYNFHEIMDVELRNALAHNNYWSENGTMYFYRNDFSTKVEVPDIEILNVFNKIHDILPRIYSIYEKKGIPILG